MVRRWSPAFRDVLDAAPRAAEAYKTLFESVVDGDRPGARRDDESERSERSERSEPGTSGDS